MLGTRPNGVAVGSAAKRIAARSDRDILVAVHLKDDGRSIGAEPRLEAPQHLAGLGVDRQKVPVGVATEKETAGGNGRAAAATHAIGGLVLPCDLVRLAVDRSEGTAHR